jgi:flagellar biosynthesis/type III secretory pathway chaperone
VTSRRKGWRPVPRLLSPNRSRADGSRDVRHAARHQPPARLTRNPLTRRMRMFLPTMSIGWPEMDSDYSRVIAAMEQYVEIMAGLAKALQRGQEALVRMDLSAFEQLTAEQERLCAQLKALATRAESDHGSPQSAEISAPATSRAEFERERMVLQQRCFGLQQRVRHLNRVNHIFVNRARQSFALMLTLAGLSQATYSPQPTVVSSEWQGRGA